MNSAGEPVVAVSHLAKRYTRDLQRSLRYGVLDIAREFRLNPKPRPALRPSEFMALDDVSFAVRPGEALAVLGANGAGKSTLLKILHGVIKPDAGEVRIHGRVGALIELGAGFDPILTGRENIALQGLAVGLSPREIAAYAERVIDFAELEEAIDAPVRSYSSGMSARLAFSVASQLKANLLLVDEVLAVGDLAFQRKCIGHLLSFLDGGGTVILVSHSVFQMQAVCSRGLLLENGRDVFQGELTTAIGLHLEAQRHAFADHSDGVDHSDDPVRIARVQLRGPGGGEPVHGQAAEASIAYETAEEHDVIAHLSVWTGDGLVCVAGLRSDVVRLGPGPGIVRARVDRLPLMAGGFTLRAAIVDARSLVPLGMLGFGDVPATVIVTADRDRFVNAMEAAQQLTVIEAGWEPPTPIPSAGTTTSTASGPREPRGERAPSRPRDPARSG